MTLTQTALLTKRVISITIALVILSLVATISYNLWYQYQLSHLPPVEEKAESKFGKLPSLVFPASRVTSSNYSYSLDTSTGNLPIIPKLIKVYFIPQIPLTLLSSDKAQALANQFGFSSEPVSISTEQYQFSDNYGGTFLINLATNDFNMTKILPALTDEQRKSQWPDESTIISDFKNYLQVKGLLSDELTLGKGSVIFSQDPRASESATITLWPQDIDSLPITTPQTTGLIKATILKIIKEADRYSKIDYINWPVDLSSSSTYQIITPEQAFSALKSGEGYIVTQPQKPQVSIATISLGYYLSEEYSSYLQPVYIFEGPDFKALIPAVNQ